MTLQEVKEFLSLQLNDSSFNKSGLDCGSFYQWPEKHIEQALLLATCYVFSIIPQAFSSLKELEVTSDRCYINLYGKCDKFVDVVSLNIPGVEECVSTSEDYTSNSLLSLLSTPCTSFPEKGVDNSSKDYGFSVVGGSSTVLKFNSTIPAGSVLSYLCASPPDSLDSVSLSSESSLCEYQPLIADYALWWLFRTDSESRSNLERAKLHFEGVKNFVQGKLLIEFSLHEDDYEFGQRRIYDNNQRLD